jgi:excisionase family DNA binding protein
MPKILRLASLLPPRPLPPERTTLPRQFLSRAHAAESRDCSVQLIDRLIHDGLLKAYPLGRRILICEAELDELMRSGVIDRSKNGGR